MLNCDELVNHRAPWNLPMRRWPDPCVGLISWRRAVHQELARWKMLLFAMETWVKGKRGTETRDKWEHQIASQKAASLKKKHSNRNCTFIFVFKTGFLYIVLSVLELTKTCWPWPQQSFCHVLLIMCCHQAAESKLYNVYLVNKFYFWAKISPYKCSL